MAELIVNGGRKAVSCGPGRQAGPYRDRYRFCRKAEQRPRHLAGRQDARHLGFDGGGGQLHLHPAVEGGTPRRITRHVPSYWHGWSPDGATLAYVGKRSAGFDIYTCPVEGGTETCLTAGFEHCDGPDYTPDGQWIWFNGQKDGRMQLWRMRPDGSALEQMTDDERVNWFPHPSPDGERFSISPMRTASTAIRAITMSNSG
jgi:Tol biopolymer transport system component